LILPPTPAQAQRGELIEGLFRTIAEANLQREQRKRLEAEQAARKPSLPPQGNLQPVPIPSSIRPPSHRPGQPASIHRNKSPSSINVRSKAAAEFAQNLVNFNGSIDPLVRELRTNAPQNPAIRAILPEAYQVAADSRALLQRCDGLSSLDPIVQPYSELDARWRQLSFRLRALDGLSSQCTSGIRSCDKMVGTLSRQLKVQPQFDRHELHDLMIVAATHMQSLLDDLELARISQQDATRLKHDCRLLRQRLLGEADRVDETTYEDVVTRFTDFASGWGAFSERVYALNDPHLQRRLDRIRECGDQTYGVLWLPPPYNAATLTASAHRLEESSAQILDQLTIRSMVSLSPQDQVRILESSRRMYNQSREFEQATKQGAPRNDLQGRFASIDKDWSYLRSKYQQMRAINRATLASINQECDSIRGALGMTTAAGPTIRHEELVQVAAALEGSSEYLDADIHRYERYLKPDSFRKSIVEASHEFHHHAKQLHAELSARADIGKLQREAEHMLDGWQQLTKDLSHAESHGLSASRTQNLLRAQQEIVPMVAQIAAALVAR
jgi:hypothetical protein